jgi:hypothetical protein
MASNIAQNHISRPTALHTSYSRAFKIGVTFIYCHPILSTNSMKTKISLHKLFFASVLAIFASSCHNDNVQPQSGKVSFSFSDKTASLASGRVASLSASYVVISAVDANGNSVYNREKIELLNFGGEYLSSPLEFHTGNFKLTEFFVTDQNDSVLYATPVTGSKLAYLVQNPLPISFTITKDQTIKLVPEVVAVNNNAPDFGYSTFAFTIVNTFDFQIAVFTYNSTIQNLQLTNYSLNVSAGTTTYFNKNLPDSTYDVTLKSDSVTYTVTVTKAGYQTYSQAFTSSQLKQYTGSSVLKIVLLDNSLATGLIAYYPFSGNANDMSGNNLNGVVHGATLTTDRKGNPNSAYSFDGVSNYISVANNALLNPPGDFSISLWTQVDPNQVINSANLNINNILRKWNGNAEGYPFSISYLNSTNPSPNRFLCVRYDGSVCLNGPTSYSGVLTNYAYMNLTFLKQGNKLRQYINGILVEEFLDTTVCSTSNSADMTFGCLGNLLRFFKGKIDDVRIYNRALTAGEVATLSAE